jgi:probable HAF family extracellular repeat protein
MLYDNGTWTDLGTLGGSASWASGINASGQVVGTARSASEENRAFIYSNGVMTDLGSLSVHGGAFANGINDSGQVVGNSDHDGYGSEHAFVYSNGKMSDLGTLPGEFNFASSALGINSSGQVVGGSNDTNGFSHAFLYSNGVMTDLNNLIDPASGWTLLVAHSINDSGQIVGWMDNAQGQYDAFLLTPVPEPASLTLLVSALLGLAGAFYLRRRRATV